uniref:Uncharacterized protein n=1 Tax=Timema bartmani TaxID=61472 RepID=A0A7R9IA88_9NEOP|nr:unnamed protein product [Timema bartmani]
MRKVLSVAWKENWVLLSPCPNPRDPRYVTSTSTSVPSARVSPRGTPWPCSPA